jgi:hypothetical protein
MLNQMKNGVVHWGAVYEGMSTVLALGFLYMIRCSVHGTALKKNIPNLSRTVRSKDIVVISRSPMRSTVKPPSLKARKFSEAVDIEAVMLPTSTYGVGLENPDSFVEHAKPTNISLKAILIPYGMSQFLAAFVGGFAITPSVAASTTMFSVSGRKLECRDSEKSAIFSNNLIPALLHFIPARSLVPKMSLHK